MTTDRVSCRQLPELIAELLGGEGHDELRQQVNRHTATCASCASLGEGLDSLVETVRSIPVPEPPATYWLDFRRELRQRIAATQQTLWYSAPGAWLRAVVATSGLALLSYAFVTQPAPPPYALHEPTVTSAQIHDLAQALDQLSVADTSSFDVGALSAELPTLAPSSADLFALYDLTLELDSATLDELLNELPG